jgi:hypothetical protein
VYNIGQIMINSNNNISHSGIKIVHLSCSFQCSSCEGGLITDFAARRMF